ncbi:MAG: hypothetical protein NTV51_26405 [Verrucomicrobia bacterium]|nr:hypothetical protein [Verrucomicrobiota bacterium]
MKKTSLVLLALLPLGAAAAELPALAFPRQKIGLPSLSLGEVAAGSPLGILKEARAWFGSKSPAPEKKLGSNMPIRTPAGDLDPKMVKTPDSTTDYKMIVKAPEVEPAK